MSALVLTYPRIVNGRWTARASLNGSITSITWAATEDQLAGHRGLAVSDYDKGDRIPVELVEVAE